MERQILLRQDQGASGGLGKSISALLGENIVWWHNDSGVHLDAGYQT